MKQLTRKEQMSIIGGGSFADGKCALSCIYHSGTQTITQVCGSITGDCKRDDCSITCNGIKLDCDCATQG